MAEPTRSLQSDTGRLHRVLLKHARDAFGDQRTVDATWRAFGYLGPPDFAAACQESDALAELLEGLGVDVAWAPADGSGLDSIYVRDAAVACDRGTIVCAMGKEARAAEPAALGRTLSGLGLPMLGSVEPPGRLEGGDVAWLGPRSLAVGLGYRTNAAGVARLRELLADRVDEVVTVPLPHWRGPGDVFHLMSMLSPLDDDLALVYAPLLPVPFRELLLERGIRLVEVPDEEFEGMACNVLAVAPRRVIALDGNPSTRARLEAAGVEVRVYAGAEISAKGQGGPTCLTRPLERSLSAPG